MKTRAAGEWRAFLEAAARSESNDCIEGGGTVRRTFRPPDGREMHASRYVWIVANSDPGELFVLHTCDNGLCVNIRHLYTGTQLQNIRDMLERQRRANVNYARGERAGRARLTSSGVREIRARYHAGESQQSIANDYGVSQRAISAIVLRQSWAHIE
jgi:hypothetical protein